MFQVPTAVRTPRLLRGLRRLAVGAINVLRLPAVGPLAGLMMEMNVIPAEAVQGEAARRGCTVVDPAALGAAGAGGGEDLGFGGREDGRLVSRRFVVRKPVPA